jgi:hypothetical protein
VVKVIALAPLITVDSNPDRDFGFFHAMKLFK